MLRRILLVVLLALVLVVVAVLGCGEQPGQREFDKGVKELERGNYVRAKSWLEKSINERPGSEENALAYNYLGIVCRRLDQIEAAVDAFEDSRRLNPDLMAPTYNLGLIMYEGGDSYRASVLLEEAALVDVDDPKALEFLGHIYQAEGDWPKARRVLYSALERASQSPRVLTALAIVELHMEGPGEAVSYLMQALEKDSHYPPALYNLGVIHEQWLKDSAQARSYYEQFLELESDGPRAEAVRKMLSGVVEAARAKPVRVKAKPKPAPVKPVAPKPQPKPKPKPKPKPEQPSFAALVAKAREAFDQGNSTDALNLLLQAAGQADREKKPEEREEALKLAVELCFDKARAHYAYGRFFAEKGSHAAALQSFKQAVVLNPNWTAAYLALAGSAMEQGEFDAAMVALKKAVQLDRQNADALWTLAKLYEEKIDLPEKAADTYREFKKLFPGDARVLEADKKVKKIEPPPAQAPKPAAPASLLPGQAQTPRRMVQRAAAEAMGYDRKLNIRKPRVRNTRGAIQAYNRGTIYHSRQDWDRAVYYYRRAVENDDTFVQAFYNLGIVYRMRGDLDLAKDAYLHAIRLRPTMVNARYNVALIYWELRQYTAAEEQAKAVLKLQPDNAGAHYVLGLVYSLEEATCNRAAQHYRKLLELAPDHPAVPKVKEWLTSH